MAHSRLNAWLAAAGVLWSLVGCNGTIEEPPPLEGPIVDLPDVPDDEDGDGLPDTLIPAASGLRRLTRAQYINSVFDLTGLRIDPAIDNDLASNGSVSVGTTRTTISPRAVEQYEDAAFDIAAQVVADETARARVVSCDPAIAGDDACLQEFVEGFGRNAWRRSLSDEEVARYLAVTMNAANVLGDFWGGVEFGVAGLLQSPNFLFRVELGDGAAVGEGESAGHLYSDHEMASRISFAICNTTPDRELLDAADAGTLSGLSGLRAEVERLAASECATEAIRGLFEEVVGLTEGHFVKDEVEFPDLSPTLGDSLQESLLSTLEAWVMEDNVSYRQFFTRSDAEVNGEVAELYGLEPGAARGFARAELPENRRGILSHGAVLARHAHAESSSPTLRGKFVRVSLLCQTIPPPPDDVGELPEPSTDAPTRRERLAAHRENMACAGCHNLMDPIGLALENYDGVGAWRDTENGALIDASGELDGVTYNDAVGLGEAVSEHPNLMECLVRNFYRYAGGHIETSGETRTILQLKRSFEESGFIRDLLVELMLSEGFRTAGEPQ
ncbi:MAG: hypothetical protein ACI9KE_006638 [Polyangiales bacterium]|jgi:hypothetical protein